MSSWFNALQVGLSVLWIIGVVLALVIVLTRGKGRPGQGLFVVGLALLLLQRVVAFVIPFVIDALNIRSDGSLVAVGVQSVITTLMTVGGLVLMAIGFVTNNRQPQPTMYDGGFQGPPRAN